MFLVVLKLIFATSLLVLGWTIITQKNMALFFIREWAEKLDTKWSEPFFLCLWCQPSVWSIFGYGLCFITGLVKFDYVHILKYPLVVCGSSIVCGMTWTLYRLMSEVTEHFKNLNEN